MNTHGGVNSNGGGKMYVEPWMTEPAMAAPAEQADLDLNQIDVGSTLRRNGNYNWNSETLLSTTTATAIHPIFGYLG